jgi:hypothetical protein
VQFDTTSDGDVTWHLYIVETAAPPTVTPIATATAIETQTSFPSPTKSPSPSPTKSPSPSPTPNIPGPPSSGAVQVAALFCLSDRNLTTISAFAPGALAGPSALSGSCFAGDTSVSLSLSDGSVMGPLRLGSSGVATIGSVRSGNHSISEQLTGAAASLEVEPGTVTRVVIRFEVALSGGDSLGAASGSSNGAGVSGGGATNSQNPLDQLNGLVTDELGGVADAGISFGSASDPNFFVVDLIGGLDAEKIAGISSASELPGVGTGHQEPSWRWQVPWLIFSAVVLAFGAMCWRRLTATRE